jgi:hypothetical protein
MSASITSYIEGEREDSDWLGHVEGM